MTFSSLEQKRSHIFANHSSLQENLTEIGGYRLNVWLTGLQNLVADKCIWYFKEARLDPGGVIALSGTLAVGKLCSAYGKNGRVTARVIQAQGPHTMSTHEHNPNRRRGSV